MFKGTAATRGAASGTFQGFKSWPWPTRLPWKGKWFDSLHGTSVATQIKGVMKVGDVMVVGTLTWAASRVYFNHTTGNYQTRLNHLNEFPPAIVAQDIEAFDAESMAKHRKCTRAELDGYTSKFAEARTNGENVEKFIFKV